MDLTRIVREDFKVRLICRYERSSLKKGYILGVCRVSLELG